MLAGLLNTDAILDQMDQDVCSAEFAVFVAIDRYPVNEIHLCWCP